MKKLANERNKFLHNIRMIESSEYSSQTRIFFSKFYSELQLLHTTRRIFITKHSSTEKCL